MDLQVGIDRGLFAANECACFTQVARKWARTVHQILPFRLCHGLARHAGDGQWLLDFKTTMKIKVIVKIATDARQVMHDFDAMFRQMVSRSNSRKEKQLWTIDRAAAHE